MLAADCKDCESELVVELYGQHQRSGGALRQFWRWLTFRKSESAPLHASMRRAVEHRALMGIAIGDLGLASNRPLAVSGLDRGWEMYAHNQPRGVELTESANGTLETVWKSLHTLHTHQIAYGDLRHTEIRTENGRAMFNGFGSAELGAAEDQLRSDVAP